MFPALIVESSKPSCNNSAAWLKKNNLKEQINTVSPWTHYKIQLQIKALTGPETSSPRRNGGRMKFRSGKTRCRQHLLVSTEAGLHPKHTLMMKGWNSKLRNMWTLELKELGTQRPSAQEKKQIVWAGPSQKHSYQNQAKRKNLDSPPTIIQRDICKAGNYKRF